MLMTHNTEMKGDAMIYGTGKYRYELVDGWAKFPEGWAHVDVCGLAIDPQDRVYVANRGDHPIMVFDCEGNLLTWWGEGCFEQIHGICIAPDGSIYCTDSGNHTVSKFSSEGKLLSVLGNKNKPSDTGYVKLPDLRESTETIKRGGPPFNRPTGTAFAASGEIYISDGYGNARVHKFTPNGDLLFSWGEPGDAPGQFMLPHSVRTDRQERVWVVDRVGNRVQIFDAQGEFLDQWTGFSTPTDLVIDSEETVYISEGSPKNQQVSIFTIDGKLLSRWGRQEQDKETDRFIVPHDIAVDSRGDIYAGEIITNYGGSRALQKFTRRN